MKEEIIFFENQNAEVGNRPPHDGDHTAYEPAENILLAGFFILRMLKIHYDS